MIFHIVNINLQPVGHLNDWSITHINNYTNLTNLVYYI
jgi:hypothetical protein